MHKSRPECPRMTNLFIIVRLFFRPRRTSLWLAFLFLFVFVSPTHAATPPSIITYQGKILENNESVTTTKAMGFLIYDAETNGNLVYTAGGSLSSTSTINVTPSQGIFSVDLGGSGTNSLATSTFSNYHTLYLEVIYSGQVLTPRKRITSVPYALNSEYLSGVSATSTSSSTYIPVSDSFGNFLFSGNSQSTNVGGGIIYINPTSTVSNGTLFGIAVNNTERFKIDTSGNVFASGTLLMAGLSTFTTGFISGSSSINNSLTVSGALNASSSIFIRNNLTLNQTAGTFDLGRFFVDSSGNISTSGTLQTTGLSTLTGGFLSDASSTVHNPLSISGNLNASSTLIVNGLSTFTTGFISGSSSINNSLTVSGALNASSSIFIRNDLTLNDNATTYRQGRYMVDSSGNTAASGTMNVHGTSTFRDLVDIKGKVTAPRHVGAIVDGTDGARVNSPTYIAVQ